MNTAIKQQWTDALRSGTYPQVRESLHSSLGYCVLGVLCDQHSRATDTDWKMDGTGLAYTYLCHDKWVSFVVRDWAEVLEKDCTRLYQSNDAGKTFHELADWIDVNL